MRIAFRVDADRTTGTGHVMRCLTLANTLAADGTGATNASNGACADVVFLCRAGPATGLIRDAGHTVLELAEHQSDAVADAAACRDLLDEPVDWLVVDNYGLGEVWEHAVRGCATRLMAIDDLADRAHDVDLLLDQNELPDQAGRYRDLLPASARTLFGARYALLRPEFGAEPRDRDGSIGRVLVSFGGSDPTDATTLALDAIERTGWSDRPIDVVVGRLHSGLDEIAERCASRPMWTLHVQTTRMAELMRAADLALGAGGTTTWERCASGLPAVVLVVAENQRALTAATVEAGACVSPGDVTDVGVDDLAQLLASLDGDPAALHSMSRAARRLCDGRGARRVTRALLAAELSFRPAAAGDEELTLRWRNDPAVRRYSGDGAVIAPDDHHAWFGRVLHDPERQLLIAEYRGAPLAVVRFDELSTGEPEVSIYLDPARQGDGWGPEVLVAVASWLRERNPVRQVRARIHPDNRASQRAFAAVGFAAGDPWWSLPVGDQLPDRTNR